MRKEMDSGIRRIFICLIVCSVGVRTRSLEDYSSFYNYNDDFVDQRSETPQEEQRQINIAMPHVHPEKHDSYMCTSVEVDDPNTYVVGYEPHAEMHTAHHMLLFGCGQVPSRDKFWNCGDMGVGVCAQGSPEKIMYAWGRNAPVLKLPKDVAFKIGDSSSRHLVLQVHYGKIDKFKNNPKLTDQSGVTMRTTKERPRHLAAIMLLASGGEIPPKQKAFNLNIGCRYDNPAVIHPFAFRVHAHSLGSVITGYRVRDGQWTLIGKGDPQRPQAFYPINKDGKLDIQNGDVLAGRCTYNTMKKTNTTYIGATMKDEMCNFYMMFYYDPETAQSSPEDSCGFARINPADYPADSIIPLPGSGEKMVMKRDEGS